MKNNHWLHIARVKFPLALLLLFFSFQSVAQEDQYNGPHISLFGNRKKKGLYVHKKFKGKYPRPEFESKITFCGYGGGLLPMGGRKVNEGGASENIFGNFGISPTLGGGVFYNKTNQHAVGAMVQYTNLFSKLYAMNLVVIKANIKYNFTPSDRKISCYIIGGGSFSLASIKQKSHEYDFYPEASYSLKNENDILVEKIHFREPNTSVSFIPVFGVNAGLGVDIKIKKTLSFFVQADYSTNYAKNAPLIEKYYPYNTSNFNYLLFVAGIKFKILKNKDLY